MTERYLCGLAVTVVLMLLIVICGLCACRRCRKEDRCDKTGGHDWQMIGLSTSMGQFAHKVLFRCERCGTKYRQRKGDLSDDERRVIRCGLYWRTIDCESCKRSNEKR